MTLKGFGPGEGGKKHKCDKGHKLHGPGKCPDPTPTNPTAPTDS